MHFDAFCSWSLIPGFSLGVAPNIVIIVCLEFCARSPKKRWFLNIWWFKWWPCFWSTPSEPLRYFCTELKVFILFISFLFTAALLSSSKTVWVFLLMLGQDAGQRNIALKHPMGWGGAEKQVFDTVGIGSKWVAPGCFGYGWVVWDILGKTSSLFFGTERETHLPVRWNVMYIRKYMKISRFFWKTRYYEISTDSTWKSPGDREKELLEM